MSEQKNRELLEGLFSDGRLKLSPDEDSKPVPRTTSWRSQSGERIVGRDRMKAFQEAYPNPPSAELRRIVGSGDLFIVEARSDYGNEIAFVTDIVEFDRDGSDQGDPLLRQDRSTAGLASKWSSSCRWSRCLKPVRRPEPTLV